MVFPNSYGPEIETLFYRVGRAPGWKRMRVWNTPMGYGKQCRRVRLPAHRSAPARATGRVTWTRFKDHGFIVSIARSITLSNTDIIQPGPIKIYADSSSVPRVRRSSANISSG